MTDPVYHDRLAQPGATLLAVTSATVSLCAFKVACRAQGGLPWSGHARGPVVLMALCSTGSACCVDMSWLLGLRSVHCDRLSTAACVHALSFLVVHSYVHTYVHKCGVGSFSGRHGVHGDIHGYISVHAVESWGCTGNGPEEMRGYMHGSKLRAVNATIPCVEV